MKRIIAMVICAVMLATALAGCSTLEKNDKGMVIDVYLTNQLYNFDPAVAFTDTAMIKIYNMIYEGLTRLNENGKWEKALMKTYRVYDTEESYKIQIDLNSTRWTDGRSVQAADVVYAWKRILSSDFKSEAASLLYCIKNARAIKNADGNVTIDDLGIIAIKTYTLEIEFEEKIDLDEFFTICASPALVPLREDIVTKNDDWAKKPNTLITNGPFVIRETSHESDNEVSDLVTFRIERSNYYYLDAEKEEALDKYVIPYRMITTYGTNTLEDQLNQFKEGTLLYLGEIALSARSEYKDQAVVTDELATHTYYFNLDNPLFAKAEVRRALSLAIDRNAIAEALVFAKPATGYVSYKVNDTTSKKSFREVADAAGELIATSANMTEAKNLLKSAGVSGGRFTLTVRDTEIDLAVADMVKKAWEELGFTVTIKALNYTATKETNVDSSVATYIYDDAFSIAFEDRDFDVIAIDSCMLSSNAFYPLSRFATEFSGSGVDYSNSNYDLNTHITGYSSDEYNDLIQRAYTAETAEERLNLLHEAEAKLIEDMPVIPIYFMQDAYLVNSSQLSGIKSSYFAARDFKKMKQKNYYEWKLSHSSEEENLEDGE